MVAWSRPDTSARISAMPVKLENSCFCVGGTSTTDGVAPLAKAVARTDLTRLSVKVRVVPGLTAATSLLAKPPGVPPEPSEILLTNHARAPPVLRAVPPDSAFDA